MTLFGFKNLSNKSLYFIGSKSVIFKDHATNDPAPDPLPGPTGTPVFRAHEIKSATIKK